MKILVIHGAGMNMRGKVQIDIFGPMTLPEYDAKIRGYAAELGVEVEIFHSNIEGEVINRSTRRTTTASPARSSILPASRAAIRRWSPRSARSASRRSRSTSPTRCGAAPVSDVATSMPRHRHRLRHRGLRARPAWAEGAGEGVGAASSPCASKGRCRPHRPTEGSGVALELSTPPSAYDADTSPAELGRRAAGLIAINDPEPRPVSVAIRATDGASVR